MSNKIFWYSINERTLNAWLWYSAEVTYDFWNADNIFFVASSKEAVEKRLQDIWFELPVGKNLDPNLGYAPLLTFKQQVTVADVNKIAKKGKARIGFIDETKPIPENLYAHSPIPSWFVPRKLDEHLLDETDNMYILRQKVETFQKT